MATDEDVDAARERVAQKRQHLRDARLAASAAAAATHHEVTLEQLADEEARLDQELARFMPEPATSPPSASPAATPPAEPAATPPAGRASTPTTAKE